MEFIEIPEFPRLHGEEAIEALCNFVKELEEERDKDLTEKQTMALIKFAWGLVSSIEAEMQSGSSDKNIKEAPFVNQLKRTFIKYIPESFRNRENSKLWKLGK